MVLLAIGLGGPAAWAADPVRGKQLYNTTPGGSGRNCATSSCHGTDPTRDINNVLKGANNPSAIQSAINDNAGGMGIYRSSLSSIDVADIAAYIGNPTAANAPSAVLSPTSLSFGSVQLGQQSATQTVTVRNGGTAALQMTAIATGSSDFPLAGGTCSTATAVAAGASCTVLLKFQPQAAGSRSGTLSITHNAAGSPSKVALSGTGTSATAVATISPGSLSFAQTVGVAAPAQTITVSNTGSASLSLSAITLGGVAAGDYSITGGSCSAGDSVAAASSCTIAVGFTPAAAGTRSGSLSITHSASGSPSVVSLNGSGTAAATPQLAVNAVSLSFPAQAIGTTSATQTLTVTNSGGAPLTFSGLSVGGTHAGDFALVPGTTTCVAGGTLAAAANCKIGIAFTPTASSGARSASLSIDSNASNSHVAVTLSGTAAAAGTATVGFNPASVDFGSVGIGTTSVAQTVSLSNASATAVAISSLSASPAAFTLSHNCPASLAAAASCTLTLRFAPTAAGSASGTVTLVSSAASSPDTLALAGTGTDAATAQLSWSGGSALNFSDTAVGAPSTTRTLSLSNPGPLAATLTQLQVVGANAGDFSIDGEQTSCALDVPLPPGQTCAIGVVFAPTAAGPRSASLDVVSDASGPGAATLAGSGIATGTAQLSLAPPSIVLTSEPNEPLQPQALVLSNVGAGVLEIGSIQAPDPLLVLDATDNGGGTCPPAPFALQPGFSCTLMVTAMDKVQSQVRIISNSSEAVSSVEVSGEPALNAGAGGCSIGRPGQLHDPIWAVLLFGAALVLWRRRQRRARHPLQ